MDEPMSDESKVKCTEAKRRMLERMRDRADEFLKNNQEFEKEIGVQPISQCPICKELMFIPCTLYCGHSFCKRCICRRLRIPLVVNLDRIKPNGNFTCPCCNTHISGTVNVSYALHDILQQLCPAAYAEAEAKIKDYADCYDFIRRYTDMSRYQLLEATIEHVKEYMATKMPLVRVDVFISTVSNMATILVNMLLSFSTEVFAKHGNILEKEEFIVDVDTLRMFDIDCFTHLDDSFTVHSEEVKCCTWKFINNNSIVLLGNYLLFPDWFFRPDILNIFDHNDIQDDFTSNDVVRQHIDTEHASTIDDVHFVFVLRRLRQVNENRPQFANLAKTLFKSLDEAHGGTICGSGDQAQHSMMVPYILVGSNDTEIGYPLFKPNTIRTVKWLVELLEFPQTPDSEEQQVVKKKQKFIKNVVHALERFSRLYIHKHGTDVKYLIDKHLRGAQVNMQ